MSAITITESNRDQYGGDYAITRTVPKIHPKLGIPLAGTRESIQGASRYWRTFMRGDIISKADPAREFNFILWNNDGTPESRDMFMLLKGEKGFVIASAEDWDLRPDLKEIYEVENGQIVLRGNVFNGRPQYEVLMVRTAERMLQEEQKLMQLDMIKSRATGKIADVIDDKRGVSVMDTQIEVIPHKYNPDSVLAKQQRE